MNATLTAAEINAIRDDFESAAHSGYVSYGISMTDGYYAPEPKSATVAMLHRSVPVSLDDFRYNTEFRPTQAMVDVYNATFHVGTDWKPETLTLAVKWERGWKTYQVTGTRHAGNLIRKFAHYRGFQGARLNDPLVGTNGYVYDNVISFRDAAEINADRHGKFAALYDHNNAHHDLTK